MPEFPFEILQTVRTKHAKIWHKRLKYLALPLPWNNAKQIDKFVVTWNDIICLTTIRCKTKKDAKIWCKYPILFGLLRPCYTRKLFFPATRNATNVALPVAKSIARLTPHFRNLQCTKMLRCKLQEKYNYPLLFATPRHKLLRVTCPAQLSMFFIRHRCVASCRKNSSCNIAFTHKL